MKGPFSSPIVFQTKCVSQTLDFVAKDAILVGAARFRKFFVREGLRVIERESIIDIRCELEIKAWLKFDLDTESLTSLCLNVSGMSAVIVVASFWVRVFCQRRAIDDDAHVDEIMRRHLDRPVVSMGVS